MDTNEALEALAVDGAADSRAFTIARLEEILAVWNRTGQRPEAAEVLSSGEYAALVLAAAREDLLGRSPVFSFLMLDGWLQKWVMQTRGWAELIGTRIGI